MIKINLRRLILLLTVSTALLTLTYTFYASYRTQRSLLMEQAMETNRAYAIKLASSTDHFLADAQRQLAYSARLLTPLMDQPAQLVAEADRLQQQNGSFNSVFIIRADGTALAAAPRRPALTGVIIDSPGIRAALKRRQPMISEPYIGASGYLLIFISQPVYTADGQYLGYVGGAIYLQEKNVLHSLLGENYYRDGSYLYVVDQQRRLIYHRDPKRVGQVVADNPAIEAVIAGQTGNLQLVNSQGTDMLTGYAPLRRTGWGIVAQRPTAATLQGLDGLMLDVLRHTFPFFLLSVLGAWWMSRVIAQPLSRLANTAQDWDSPHAPEQIRRVRSWYVEAEQLKRAMLAGLAKIHQKLGRLNQENITDTLTGLVNRRGMQTALAQWQAEARPFAVIALDVDHFKQVNDQFGHDTGDRVLQYLARQMRNGSRSNDLLCRLGGEEFCMLLPDCSQETAIGVAERLRTRIAATDSPTGTPITLSAGVSHWPAGGAAVETVLKQADKALYKAKHNGRNRVEAALS